MNPKKPRHDPTPNPRVIEIPDNDEPIPLAPRSNDSPTQPPLPQEPNHARDTHKPQVQHPPTHDDKEQNTIDNEPSPPSPRTAPDWTDPKTLDLFTKWFRMHQQQQGKDMGGKKKKSQAPPIKAIHDDDPRYSLREELARHKVDITQFLEFSSRMRAEFIKLMQKRDPASTDSTFVQKCAADAVTNVHCVMSNNIHQALPLHGIESPVLGFVNGQIGNMTTSRILVDGGS